MNDGRVGVVKIGKVICELEIGDWRLEIGDWRLELGVGSWEIEEARSIFLTSDL